MQILGDYPKLRDAIYAIASIVLLGLSAWQASNNNWVTAATFFTSGLVTAMAKTNTNTDPDFR